MSAIKTNFVTGRDMDSEQQVFEYQANNADEIVGEIFSNKTSVGDAIERLRTRLLDLSARNRLLNYRHPKGRCLQIVDEPNVNLIYDRLYIDGKSTTFKYVPEPSPNSYEGKRPEARLYAPRAGISTAIEFEPNPDGSNGRRLTGLQTLLYPQDLERQLRKIANEAKTAVEETGSNMLFLVFGFLEFYDSDDSEKPMLAPLLSLPVVLAKGGVDTDTRTYQYTIQHNGEDLAENYTLREKLRRDFTLSLPEFNEEESPETYFKTIEQAIRNKRRWKVRRQLTLGMFSFGKLAIWADLDTRKYPGIVQHSLIKSIFSSGSEAGHGGFFAEDYPIDEMPAKAQHLVYDADSSQHSAIIDVLSGKNLVINGPPGTGKSQTITNIIAAALFQGKKVLFVSEKLAALEVVRSRLNHAGLGDFCLELHSHKMQKKKFLEDIQTRIEKRFPAPPLFQDKLVTLHRQKMDLARHAELMGGCFGNTLGLTVNEVFWAAERRRQELGSLSAVVNAIGFPDAAGWSYDDVESRKSRVASLAELYDTIGLYNYGHPWWGFQPAPLAPSDDDAIARIILQAIEHARITAGAAAELVGYFGLEKEPDPTQAAKIREMLDTVPDVPENADPTLLPRMFDAESDPTGRRSSRLLADVATGVTKTRELYESAARVLVAERRLSFSEMEEIRTLADTHRLSPSLLGADLGDARDIVARFEKVVECFARIVRVSTAPYGSAGKILQNEFLANCHRAPVAGLASFPICAIAKRAKTLGCAIREISEAVCRVGAIATRRGLSYDHTPDSVANLAGPDGLPGLRGEQPIDAAVMIKARSLAALPLSDKPILEIKRIKSLLETEISACSKALQRCWQVAERLGISFDGTERAVSESAAVAKVAALAPHELLEYRRATYGQARTVELIEKIRHTLAMEMEEKATYDPLFYLDALPPSVELKAAVMALRQKEGLFALFDREWRKARKLHSGLSINKKRISSKQRADELAGLVSWREARTVFTADSELKECFGGLFRGLESDTFKLSRLNNWYLASQTILVECPGLTEKIDLTNIPGHRISELAANTATVQADVERLAQAESAVHGILGVEVTGFREVKSRNWVAALECLGKTVEELGALADFFTPHANSELSPQDAVRLMEARVELDEVAPDLLLLQQGEQRLREAGGDELGRVADLVGAPWSEVVTAVSSQASLVAIIAAQSLPFAGEDSLLSSAMAFATAKSELDEGWDLVCSLPGWNHFASWPAMIDAAREDAAAARETIERFSLFAQRGVSASEVFNATSQEAEARSILDRFANSEEVLRMLGDLFDGAATNLDRLSQTHEWGYSLCSLDLPQNVQIRLLTGAARVALGVARSSYLAVETGYRAVREQVARLTSFGTFDWDDWQKQVRVDFGCDVPSAIVARLELVVNAPGSILPWSKYLSLRVQLQQEGLGSFVSALEKEKLPSHSLAAAFELAAFHSIGRSIYQAFPELSRFNGSTHEKTRSDYRELDREIVSLTGKSFANQIDLNKRVPDGRRGTTVGEYTEMHLLLKEISKKKRHIPIRQLLKRAGRALQELKPCFMMGPLSVAQYLEQGALKFDLVVMDEASQLRPEEALGAVARGTQLIVVGDPKQLPPTSFFDRMSDSADDETDDDAPAATTGMESILDICQQLFTPVRSLRWHYRSQHESLIAFSNHHFYKNLIVFPSPYARHPGLGVKYRYVKSGVYKDRQNIPEAQHLVDAVLGHMLKRPEESLGIVTLNQTQRELIEELLEKKLKTFKEGADFIGRWESEGWPFFVKNLENVQGDERDVIFISTTFGKAPGTSKPRQNFGPISRPDGWRRLNVLFTRAKRRIELFTSMVPEDIVVDSKTPLGTKALRDYLDFAKRGVLVTTDEGEREPDSDFEVSVANVVTALGYEVKPQLGVAGFFLDMAVRNPDRPGEFLAGIECDGATYHSGFSVRDRDRIRQDILESLGWKGRIHRIWSTDWFYNPRREVERLQSFLEERRRHSANDVPGDWEGSELYDDGSDGEDAEKTTREIEEIVVAIADSSGEEDLFVEIGDRVTYCLVEDPNHKTRVMIVDSESNAKLGIINEKTPLAQALLGLSPGEIGDLQLPGQKTRQLCVLKIQRQDDL